MNTGTGEETVVEAGTGLMRDTEEGETGIDTEVEAVAEALIIAKNVEEEDMKMKKVEVVLL